jgi:hypothetical protein
MNEFPSILKEKRDDGEDRTESRMLIDPEFSII